jgi:ATP-dependent RNA helicase DOB1
MMYFELLKRFDGGKTIPLLDPIADMEIESKGLTKLMGARKKI